MMEKYRRAIDEVDHAVMCQVLDRLRIDPTALKSYHSAFDCLDSHGMGQADVVLELLRINRRPALRHVEPLVGRPITRCPPVLALFLAPSAVVAKRRSGDDRRVTRVVKHNPRLPTTKSFYRFQEFKKGRTIAELLRRGVTRRDLRNALRKKWISVEKESRR
jgi:hypothetical protein